MTDWMVGDKRERKNVGGVGGLREKKERWTEGGEEDGGGRKA